MLSLNKKNIIKIIVFTVILLILASIIFFYFTLNKTTIYDGVYINNVSVGGYNSTEVIKILENHFSKVLNNKYIKLKYNSYNYKLMFNEIEGTYNYHEAVNEALNAGRKGSIFTRLKEIYTIKKRKRNIMMKLSFNKKKINNVIDKINRDIGTESKRAKIELKNGRFLITPEVIGIEVDKNSLMRDIYIGLNNKTDINIPVIKDIPKLTKKELEKVKYKLGSYTTFFKTSSLGRVNNIQISAEKINGTVLSPREVFSLNKATGIRNKDTGYMESKIILDGDFVDGVGGGVCQLSTTLYNTVLLSELEVVERHHHSLPVKYVPKGLDAAVAYDYLDFKFKNNYKFPIYLDVKSKNRQLTITIYGGKITDNRVIKFQSITEEVIKPEVEEKVDETLKPEEIKIIQQGRYGYKVKVYKNIFVDGEKVDSRIITEDFYKPVKHIIKKGTGVENITFE